mmetsp:Transcript_82867/g.221430  ORF Transcript_82867/g.221430 Transcript_82867/m.221430 type:complete len:220 (+) Transcript_82867:1674-2333(+)
MPLLGPGPRVLGQRGRGQARLHGSLGTQHGDHRAHQDPQPSPVGKPLIIRIKRIDSLGNEKQGDETLEKLLIQRGKVRQQDLRLSCATYGVCELHPEFNRNLRDVRVWKGCAKHQDSKNLLHLRAGPLRDHNIKEALRGLREDSRQLRHNIQAVLVVLQGLLQHRSKLRRDLHNLRHQPLHHRSVLLRAGRANLERLDDALRADFAELGVLDVGYAQRK